MEFRVQSSGFRVQGSGFGVQGSEFRVWGSGFRVQGSGFGIQGVGYHSCDRLGLPRVNATRLFIIRPAYMAHQNRPSLGFRVESLRIQGLEDPRIGAEGIKLMY